MAVSGLTQLDANFSTAGAGAPFTSGVTTDFAFNPTVTLPDNTSSARAKLRIRLSDSGGTVAGYYGKRFLFTAVNATSNLFLVWMAFDNWRADQTNEIRIAFSSSNSDWARYQIFGNSYAYSTNQNVYHPVVVDLDKTPDDAAGTLNKAAIDRLEVSYYHNGTADSIRPWVGFAYVADMIWTGGTAGSPGTLQDFSDYFASTFPGPVLRQPIRRSGVFYDLDLSKITIGNNSTQTYFDLNIAGVAFSASDTESSNRFLQTSVGGRRLKLDGSGGGAITLNALISSSVGWTLETTANSDATMRSCTLNNVDAFALAGPITARQTQVAASAQVDAADFRLLSGRVVNSDSAVAYAYSYATGDTPPNGLIIADGETAQISCAPGDDLSDVEIEFEGDAVMLLNPSTAGATAINLLGITATTTLQIDNATANNIAITVAAGTTTNVASPTTGGGTVTVQTPVASFVGADYADGTRYYLAHQQVFTVAAADISTAADTITLGNDSNGDAPDFAASAPYTLVKIDKTTGATLPTTSPQIIDGGRYYATISGSEITLFVAAADVPTTPITISAAGTDSGGSVFTLTAETELANGTVSGGSGLSVALTLSDGANVLRKAIYWSNSGTTTATPLYQQTFSWSSTAGIADPQSINVATEADETHERIVGLSNIELEGPIENASGTLITAINPASDGSTLDSGSGGPYGFALEGRGKIQINASDSDGISNWQDLYIWGKYVTSTQSGIRLVTATTFSAVDVFNFRFDNLEFDNTSSTTLYIVGGNGRSADGSNFVASTTTGSIVPNALAQGTGAVIETGTSGLTAGEAAQLETLYNTTTAGTGATAFSSTALANAPSGGLDAAGVRAAVGLASANLDTQLADLPTVAEFEARTLLAANYFDPAADTVANVTTVGSISGVTFPTNFSALAIDGTGQVTAGNMRGTDNALLAASYTAPANSDIIAIKAKTDQLTFTVAGQVDANALTGGGGDDAATIYSYFTALARADAFKADVSGLATASSLATVSTNVDAILEDTGTTIPSTLAGLSTLTSGDIGTALGSYGAATATNVSTAQTAIQGDIAALNDVDAATIWAYALSEPTSIPAGATTAANKLSLLYALARNRVTQTSSTQTLYADDGTTAIGTASTSDDGTTFTRGELS